MTHTRFLKLLMAPVLAGIFLCPAGVYGQTIEKVTVSAILKSPENYNELKVQVTGFVTGTVFRQSGKKYITIITLSDQEPGDVKQEKAGKLMISIQGKYPFVKGNKVNVIGIFHISYINPKGKTLSNVILGSKIRKVE